MSHTPGPWIEERHKQEPKKIVDIRTADGVNTICIMFRCLVSQPEFESNIRAIKAVPEMIDALKAARAQMLKAGITHDNADIYNTIDNAIKRAGQ